MTGKERKAPDPREEEFQNCYDIWERSGYTDKKSWERMFILVYEASKAAVLSRCRGVNRPNASDVIIEYTTYLMGRIKEDHFRPNMLRSYCAFAGMWLYKDEINDKTLDFDNDVEVAACDILGNRIIDYSRKNYEEVRLPHGEEFSYE